MRRSLRNQRGFTLVEMIVVAALLALLAGLLYGTLNGITRTVDLVTSGIKTERAARLFFSRISRELQSRVPERLSSLQQSPTSAPTNPPPGFFLQGGYFIGTKGEGGVGSKGDSIRFVSDGVAQEPIGGLGNRGRVEVAYGLREAKREKEELSDAPKTFELMRGELSYTGQPNLGATPGLEPNDEDKPKELQTPLMDNVVSLQFRYLQDGKWIESWSDSQTRFPEAVEITLVLLDDRGKEEIYHTAIAVDRAKAAISGSALS